MSEVVTKRLLTDETGQLLVTALNSIAASCKPDATEINMGPNDDTKVATQINSLSDQIGTYVIEANTLANIESALVTFGATLGANDIRKIRFNISTASGVFLAQGYMGTIKRYGSGARYIVEVQNCDATGSGDVVTGSYYNSAWKWQQLATTDDLTLKTVSLTFGSNVNLIPRQYAKRTKTTLFLNVVLNFSVATLAHGETILTFPSVTIDSPIDIFLQSESTGNRIKIYTAEGGSRLMVSGATSDVAGYYDINVALPIRN